MRFIIFLIGFFVFSNANEPSVDQVCKGCHQSIYDEYYSSQHSKSHLENDVIHKAIFGFHPDSQNDEYSCKECHAPKPEIHKGISCLNCHAIKDIQANTNHNTNVYEEKEKYFYSKDESRKNEKVEFKKDEGFFSMFKSTKGSPYHTIDFSNENFYNSNVCLGCHSHNTNSSGIDACRMENKKSEDGSDCISCHMPKVQGTATSIQITDNHAFHGFAGAFTKPEMLSKYVEITLDKKADGFDVIVHNKAPHNLLLQPLRVAVLKVNVISNGVKKSFDDVTLMRVLGNEGNPTFPWMATEVLKDDMLKDNETRAFSYEYQIKPEDKVEIELGYFIVNPKVAQKLNVESKFTILKRVVF